jgi:UDP-N-acetylmuramyl tripeptide synthase
VIFRVKVGLARLARILSRALGRRGGTTLPGRLLLALDRGALARLADRLEEGAVLISATNGKTTTAGMVAAVLGSTGREVVHNRAGSNMDWGVATALLDAGDAATEIGVFEVDEAYLKPVATALDPRVVVLSNLFRDQLDRYGELESLAEGWAGVVNGPAASARLVLNADDPLVADLGRDRQSVIYFGLEDDSQAIPELQHAADSKHCRNCGAAYAYAAVFMGHLGRYACPNCGRSRPAPEVAATKVRLDGMSGSDVEISTPLGALTLRLPLPGLYNVYNALAATATAIALDVDLQAVTTGLSSMSAAFGRTERLRIGEQDAAILLVKNPAGTNEVLRTLALEQGPLDLWMALNDRIADGRDVSWIWDADYELLAGRVARITCSGTRAEELALRLKYAGIEAPTTVDHDLERSLDHALGHAGGTLFALPTYTALLELRDLLSRRGVADRWSA